MAKVPTTKQYEDLLRPLTLSDVTAKGAHISARLGLTDALLYGKFLIEWQAFMDALADYAPTVLKPCLALLASPSSPEAVSAARSVLGNVDLDNPVRDPNSAAVARKMIPRALWDRLADGTLRGCPTADRIFIYHQVGDEKPRHVGEASLAGLPRTGFDGSPPGRIAPCRGCRQ